jgi:hypothetical protein
MEPDISIWRKTGHFYFALTPVTTRDHGPGLVSSVFLTLLSTSTLSLILVLT